MKKFFNFKISVREIIVNALIIVFLIIIKASVLANYGVPTGSMRPTILEGDKIFSNNAAYGMRIPLTKYYLIRWAFPKRGDVIAFIYPGDDKTSYTKRVIGVPGDIIEVGAKALKINGKEVKRTLLEDNYSTITYKETIDGKDHFIQEIKNRYLLPDDKKFTVPPDHLFVMGDNRDNSSDSRFWGFVPFENVRGKLIFCWLSVDPQSSKIKFERIGRIR